MVERVGSDEPDDTRADRTRWAGVVVATVTALVVAGVALGAVSAFPTDRRRADSSPQMAAARASTISLLCDSAVGEPAADASPADRAVVAGVAADMRIASPDGCGVGSATVLGDGVHQWVAEGSSVIAVVASPLGAVRHTREQMQSFFSITGRDDPASAVALAGGVPIPSDETIEEFEVVIPLSGGGLLLGWRADTPSFWIPAALEPVWRELGAHDGGLGAPLSHPYVHGGEVRQDFVGGHITGEATTVADWLAAGAEAEVHMTEPDLDAIDQIDGQIGIVRQRSGTRWWHGEGHRRRWISDHVWRCLGGHEMLLDEVDGPTLAAIPLGTPATCDMAL